MSDTILTDRRRARGLAVAALAASLGFFPGAATGQSKLPKVGQRAPNFQLRDRTQALVRLESLVKRGIVVLDFFRTDCAPCRKSLPALKRVKQAFKGQPLEVVIVALLEDDNGERKLEAFLKRNALPFTVVLDAYGVVAKKYIAHGNSVKLPSLFVIDRKQVIRLHHEKALANPQRLIDKLRGLM